MQGPIKTVTAPGCSLMVLPQAIIGKPSQAHGASADGKFFGSCRSTWGSSSLSAGSPSPSGYSGQIPGPPSGSRYRRKQLPPTMPSKPIWRKRCGAFRGHLRAELTDKGRGHYGVNHPAAFKYRFQRRQDILAGHQLFFAWQASDTTEQPTQSSLMAKLSVFVDLNGVKQAANLAGGRFLRIEHPHSPSFHTTGYFLDATDGPVPTGTRPSSSALQILHIVLSAASWKFPFFSCYSKRRFFSYSSVIDKEGSSSFQKTDKGNPLSAF